MGRARVVADRVEGAVVVAVVMEAAEMEAAVRAVERMAVVSVEEGVGVVGHGSVHDPLGRCGILGRKKTAIIVTMIMIIANVKEALLRFVFVEKKPE